MAEVGLVRKRAAESVGLFRGRRPWKVGAENRAEEAIAVVRWVLID